ncbi:DUF7657 domain-containing protein [Pseudomonas iridis]
MSHIERNRWQYVVFAALSVITITWIYFGFYQSHFLSALRILGDYSTQSVIGAPKEGRGDEWSTYIPMLKQAYLEGFPFKSSVPPYFENLDWFIAIPKLDVSLLFLPNQIAYWIIPGANALALQGAYYNLILIFSIFWLLRNLGAKTVVAISVAGMILFSHFYQVWWTSNFPALGAGILPFAVLSSKLHSSIKYPLFFWAVAHAVFGQIYPPFYVSMAFAVVPLLFTARPDLLTRKNIAFTIICVVAALAVFLLMRWDFVRAVSATSYPGVRISTGGGVTPQLLLSSIFPTMPVGEFPAGVDSVHEFSLVGTIIPLLFLALLPFISWDKFSIRLTITTVLMLALMSIYMIIGFPVWLSKISLLYLVPGRRMLLGFSVLVVLYCSLMLSHHWNQMRVSTTTLACFIFSLISFAFGQRADIAHEFYLVTWVWLAPTLLSLTGLLIGLVIKNKSTARDCFLSIILIGMVVVQCVVFASFNPIMRAKDILTPVDSQLTRDVRALVSESNGHGVSVVGNFGHLLRGEGLAVYNAIHLVNVDRRIYANLFGISNDDSEKLFNQFRGISFDNIGALNAAGATVIFPATVGGKAFAHDVVNRKVNGDSLIDHIETKMVKQENNLYELIWNARLSKPTSLHSRLSLSVPCTVKTSWLTRYPLPVGGEPLEDVALRGLAGKIEIQSENSENAERCLKELSISNTP